jgi:beta-glucosidase
MDNFELAWGYMRRFGIYYVDFATERRLPKRSAKFYARVAHANALPPSESILTARDFAPPASRSVARAQAMIEAATV